MNLDRNLISISNVDTLKFKGSMLDPSIKVVLLKVVVCSVI